MAFRRSPTNVSHRPSYSMSAHGNQTDVKSAGRFILNPNSNAEYWKPSWQGKETIIRLLPPVYDSIDNPGEQEIGGYRFSNDYNDFQDWIRVYPAVRSFGQSNSITMILNNPATNPDFDVKHSPASILQTAIFFANRDGKGKAEWAPLLMGGNDKSAPLSRPTFIALARAAVYMHSDKTQVVPSHPYPKGLAPLDHMVVFEIPPSAYKTLAAMWDEKKQGYTGDPEDSENYYVYGDPVSMEHGRFIHFFQQGNDPRDRFIRNMTAPVPGGGLPVPSAAAHAQATQKQAQKGYDTFVTRTFPGYPDDNGFSASLVGWDEIIKQKYKPWESVLRFYTQTEQAHIIARLFPPSAILYAFRDKPEWIPDDVQDAAVAKVTTGYEAPSEAPAATPARTTPWKPQPPAPTFQGTPLVRPGALGAPTAASQHTLPPPPLTTKNEVVADAGLPSGEIPDDAPTPPKRNAASVLAEMNKRNQKAKVPAEIAE